MGANRFEERAAERAHSPIPGLANGRVYDLDAAVVLVVVPVQDSAEWASKLTETELSIAKLAASGLSNRVIAGTRGSAERTVANQLASVYRKLGISGRRELRARITER
jgi:DNA-binding NarL/FixJ family response regulator